METFTKGEIVIIPFPFSNLSGVKNRPALVLSDRMGNDLILCQITSQFARDSFCISLIAGDFIHGGLRIDSFIRPNKLFTAAATSILSATGKISACKYNMVVSEMMKLIS